VGDSTQLLRDFVGDLPVATSDRSMSAGTEVKRRFQLSSFEGISLSSTHPYLVRDLIPREGIIVIWGPPKCGKTFLTFDLAMHVALGWEYRGHKVTGGSVVYIACEGTRGLAARVEAFRRARMGDVTASPAFYLLATRLDLAGEYRTLIEDIRGQLDERPVMVVIDTLNRSLAGSESKDEDMGAYIRGADAIREAFGCAVVIVHHCGIADQRPRGHTSLAGAADAQLSVKRDADGAILAKVDFMKDGEEGAEIRSMLKVVDLGLDDDKQPMTSCVIEPAEGGTASTKLPPKRLSKAASVALEELLNQIADDASDPISTPASKEIPRDVQGTSKTRWRARLESTGIINADGSPREQLRRILVELRAAGLAREIDGFVWPVTTRHKP
jgi:hypothetical protein